MSLTLGYIVGRLGMFADQGAAGDVGRSRREKEKPKFVCGQPENLGREELGSGGKIIGCNHIRLTASNAFKPKI